MTRRYTKLSAAQRAAQFLPFSPLRGFYEALEAKENAVVYVSKAELAEDMAEELNRCLLAVRPGQLIAIIYYRDDGYRRLEGMTAGIDPERRQLTIVDQKISFDDIREIRFL